MLCVERLPTISEYEPRCGRPVPTIVVDLCNTEILHGPTGLRSQTTSPETEDVTDNASTPTKEESTNVYVKQTNGDEFQKINATNNSKIDIRNRKISPSWSAPYTITYKTDVLQDSKEIDIRHTKISAGHVKPFIRNNNNNISSNYKTDMLQDNKEGDIRHTKIRPSSNIIPRVRPRDLSQGYTTSTANVRPCIRNTNVTPVATKVIPRSTSNISSSSSSSDSSSSNNSSSNNNYNNSSNYKTYTSKDSNSRDIRHTKIRPNNNNIHRMRPNEISAAACIRNTIVTAIF